MRNHRKNTVLAAAAIAALSLGLTACGGGDGASGAKDAGSATSSPSTAGTGDGGTAGGATANQTATKGGSGSTGGSASGGSTAGGSTASTGSAGGSKAGSGTGGSTGSTGGKSSAAAPVCAYGDIKVTAAKADEVPTEHITLTATNTSGRSCTLLEYPLIAFGPIQTAKDVPAVAKSKPAAPVVLKPGAPAYANVRIALGGAHEDNKVVNEFNVNLFAAQGPAEGSIVVKAPAGGLAVDEAAAKTGYWTYELRNGADEF
ncbi:DUF4232 domain-containing protein [Streptomyces litmocidini]|uniref:DUF4232 domain-containing protein n=1 Tax=Streptomyces litmocidini TaxID=67318 RepID=UPI0033E37CE3